jgi:hypothetical protein
MAVKAKTVGFRKRGPSRTVKCRIDGFEDLDGAISIRACVKPIVKGRAAAEIFFDWVETDEFAFTLRANQSFPITIRGHRYPQDIGEGVITKETGKMLDPMEPSTWPLDAQLRGMKTCMESGYCIHEERGATINGVPYVCPRAVDLPNGLIRNANEVWVLREDGPPVPESMLVETRVKEEEKRKLQGIELEAKRKARMGIQQVQIVEVPAAPLTGTTASLGEKATQ